jgi:choline dehydrogenase
MGARQAFDVVVVGGGAAGCVAAARLAERGSVLLLEAGPDLRAQVPAGLRNGWHIAPTPELDWGYLSEPDRNGAVSPLRRLRALGGTSWVTRYVLRGAPADYDAWAARGNPGWSYAELLPYFRHLETDLDFPGQDWHGDSGPLPVTRYPEFELSAVTAAAARVVAASGLPFIEDHNQPGSVGIGRAPRNSRGGDRVTTLDAYLSPETSARPEVRCGVGIDRLELERGRVVGVRTIDGRVLHAERVVLCAGVYGTPAILMRSGIGPGYDLKELDIEVAVDIPGVGANLSDHVSVAIECGYEGPGRESPNLDVMATFHSSGQAAREAPNLMFWFADPRGDPGSFDLEVVLLRPEARGRLRLRSGNPDRPPIITLPRLEPVDIERLVEGLQRAMSVAEHPTLRAYCAQSASPQLRTAAECRAFVRGRVVSLPHVSGTCAMGPPGAEGAVVDNSGAVHGVEGLTVADASVIPVAHSGFTHVVAIAVAERIAEHLSASL